MKEIRFPYLRYLVTPPTQKPAKHVYRPVIPIKLFVDKKIITFDGLIDLEQMNAHFQVGLLRL